MFQLCDDRKHARARSVSGRDAALEPEAGWEHQPERNASWEVRVEYGGELDLPAEVRKSLSTWSR